MITDFCDNLNELDEFLADKVELFDEKYTSLLPFQKRVTRFLRYINFKIWLCILIIAFLSAASGLIADFFGKLLFKNRISLVKSISSPILKYLTWTSLTIIAGLISTFLCDKFSKEAEGSGIP